MAGTALSEPPAGWRPGHLAAVEVVRSPGGQLVVRKRMRCPEFLYNHLYVLRRLAGCGVVPALRSFSLAGLELEYDYVIGSHIADVAPAHREGCFFAAGASLALLHAHHLDGYGPLSGPRDTQSDWWELQDRWVGDMLQYCRSHGLLGGAAVEQLTAKYARRRSRVAAERHACLTHCDFRPDNLLFAAGEGRWQCKVLDFDHASASPPHLDFGRVEQDLFEAWPGARQPFLSGYLSVSPLPDLAGVLPLYRLIWPLSHVVWGTRNQAAGLVSENLVRLGRLCGCGGKS